MADSECDQFNKSKFDENGMTTVRRKRSVQVSFFREQRMGSAIICCLVWSLSAPVIGWSADAVPIPLGSARQLFFDDRIVAASKGLKRIWHQPEKELAPVLKKQNAWEGMGPYVYGTVLRDPISQQFKVWYNCYVGGQPDYFIGYATSKDGLQWDRPDCNTVRDPRLPAGNNVVLLGSGLPQYRQCLSPSVLFRPDEPDPLRRYAMVYWDVSAAGADKFFGLCLAYSSDGIHWTNDNRNPVFDGVSDVTDAQYDPAGKRYLLHYKIWRVEGDVVSSKLPRGTAGRVSYWPTWDTVKGEGDAVRFQGRLVDFASNDTSPMSGSIDFSKPPTYRRVVARAESTDLVHWTDARLVFELPESSDPPGVSTYGMSTFSYEGRYLGLLRVFHDEHEIDLELAVSDDDRSWQRPTPGRPFIPLGQAGTFDAGMVFSANSPVVVDDELWFYFGAFTGHHAAADTDQVAAIGLAKLRRDGFVSFTAANEMGELITAPLKFKGDRLVLNAVAKDGELMAEIQDENGNPLPGFAFSDCDSFQGDSVSHAMAWRRNSDVSQFQGKAIRLSFRLKNVQFYAFQFQTSDTR